MANPFFVQPAGTNIPQGLSGLSNIIGEGRAKRAEIEQQQAQQAAQEAAKQQVFQAFERGDPDEIRKLSVLYPEMQKQILAQAEAQSGINQEDRLSFTRQLMSNPEAADQLYQNRIQTLIQQGRDPTHTQQSYERYKANPEAFMREAEAMYAYMAPEQEWEAYQSRGGKKDPVVVGGKLVDRNTGEVVYEGDPEQQEFVQLVSPEGEMSTARWDGNSFYDMSGKKKQVPEGYRVIKSAQLSGNVQDLGLPESEEKDIRNAEVGARSFIATATDAINLLQEYPDINTFTARASSIANNLKQEAKAIGRATGVEFDESILEPSNHADTFDALGIQNARMRSMITSLAYSRALANNPDGRISNADLNAAITEIGGSAADPRAFAEVLRDNAQRIDRNFRINYRVRTNQEYPGESLLEGMPTYEDRQDTTTSPDINALLDRYAPAGQ